nr:MFS transporter [Mitsuokella multacida]
MAESTVTKKLGPNPTRKEILANWTPEDPVFWKKFGEKIAKQNLYTSTWALVLSFVVWTLWATIAAKLNMVGFHFTDEQLFTLAALQDLTTSYDTFVLLVSFIGIADANLSASMANIGFFFPKAHKGLALGINAGVGNLGVSLIYLTAPLLLGWNLSSFFGPGVETPNGMMYVQNVCYFWTVPTALTLVLIWMFMDNLPLPKQSPKSMLSIFGNKHTWLMCWIYTCGFGSFIGFSAALGLLVSKEFPEVSFSMAAFLGPFIGAGIRPVGGWLADRLDSGSKVTLVSLFIMLAASIVVLFGIQTHAFALFFGSFLLLFLTTGFINGASFRMIPYIFDNPFHASLVTGFTAAIAAYGAFLIPKIFGWSYANFQNVAPAFYILIAFTVLTIIITWFFYARKGSGIKC